MGNTNIAIVAGSFHVNEIAEMVSAATEAITQKGGYVHSIAHVPGAYEIPLAAKCLLLKNEIAGLVVLGIIERGQTAHGRVMGQSVSDALIGLQLELMEADRDWHHRTGG